MDDIASAVWGAAAHRVAVGGDESYVTFRPDRSDWERYVGRRAGAGHSRPRSLSAGRRGPMSEMLVARRLLPACG